MNDEMINRVNDIIIIFSWLRNACSLEIISAEEEDLSGKKEKFYIPAY